MRNRHFCLTSEEDIKENENRIKRILKELDAYPTKVKDEKHFEFYWMMYAGTSKLSKKPFIPYTEAVEKYRKLKRDEWYKRVEYSRKAVQRKAYYCKDNKIEFDLTWKWFLDRVILGCELSGIQFVWDDNSNGDGIGLYTPSIDRINNDVGYTKINCRLILNCLNTMKGAASDDELVRICYAVTSKQYGIV